jgi:hypothetical protein
MSEIDNLNERLAKLEAERSEVRMQIAARHGEVPADEVAPTQEPADKRQAELSEEARKRQEAASETVPAGYQPEEDRGAVDTAPTAVSPHPESRTESRAVTERPQGTSAPAKGKA